MGDSQRDGFASLWEMILKLLLESDSLASLSCDGLCIKVEVGNELLSGAASTELVVYAYLEYGCGALFAENFSYSGTETADDGVLFASNYCAASLSFSNNELLVKRLDCVNVYD